VLAQS